MGSTFGDAFSAILLDGQGVALAGKGGSLQR
jgi:hypothetical protein